VSGGSKHVGAVGQSVTAYEGQLPAGADYWASGGFDSASAARAGWPQDRDIAEGETYEHTFETRGEDGYFCIPHESSDLVGTLTVT
jgi:plastocyanin